MVYSIEGGGGSTLPFPTAALDHSGNNVASRSKQKGDRDERGLIARLAERGVSAHRVPLSGAVEGYEGDVIIEDKYVVECKVRARGFQQIYGWLQKHVDFLTIRQDRAERLVVMRESMFIKMLLKFLGRGK
tara:strand:- start:1485 stop:1877 length:393 start_codon:yes stop_codon:yes gene_type:complete